MSGGRLEEAARSLLARPIVQQFLRFAMVGAVATAIHYAILIALVELSGVNPILATSLGFICASVVSYLMNRAVTFKAQNDFTRGLLLFVALGSVGLVLNAAIMGALTNAGLSYILAQICATGIVLIWNFGSARFIVFRPR